MAGEQPPQGLGVDPSPPERGVKAAPAATVRGFEAQMNGRRNDDARGEHRVAELEERVGAPIEAFVERAAEGTPQIVKGCVEVSKTTDSALRSLRRLPSQSLRYPSG